MNTAAWYPLAGFAVLAWLTIVIAAVVSIPLGKAQPWIQWGASLFAGLMAFTSGRYARGTWLEDGFVAFIGWHPIILLIVGLLFVAAVVYAVAAAIPDVVSRVALAGAILVACWALPLAAAHASPPGDVGANFSRAVLATSNETASWTAGWFTG